MEWTVQDRNITVGLAGFLSNVGRGSGGTGGGCDACSNADGANDGIAVVFMVARVAIAVVETVAAAMLPSR